MEQELSADQAAKLALQFLARVEIKGAEVGAFVAVSNWLNYVAQQREREREIMQSLAMQNPERSTEEPNDEAE